MSSLTRDLVELLAARSVDLLISVPCKYFAPLLEAAAEDRRFELITPAREEEGIAIAAGAWMAGRRPLCVYQNSGLGNLVNAWCSLHRFYELPLALLLSHRGDADEAVPAQVPMGDRTSGLLELMEIEPVTLAKAEDLRLVDAGLARYAGGDSVAWLGKKSFWSA